MAVIRADALRGPASTEQETIRFLLQLHHTQYWNSTDLFAKAWAFNVAITTAVIGFLFTKEIGLSTSLRHPMILGIALLWIIALIGFSAWLWGLLKLILLMERLVDNLATELPVNLSLGRHYKLWRRLLCLLGINTIAVALAICTGVVLIYFDVLT